LWFASSPTASTQMSGPRPLVMSRSASTGSVALASIVSERAVWRAFSRR
jgi:hypothetical protein